MTDAQTMIHVLMQGLVEHAGGPENAARRIGARFGDKAEDVIKATRKGTISRRCNGTLTWPLDEIMALEEATGDYRVREWLAASRPQAAADASLMQLAGDVSRETGEAISAVLAMLSQSGTPENALKEALESQAFLDRLVAELREVVK
ncbi:hypothetical protein JI664_14825 [Rhodobacter sp. NTK016B]|uniref:hypothetical protein n=1 Tax=Rhodobacter sp. NTK016B TaxID=2759676 RepID=UPI001A9075A8|nr:hypothetical protein [Rhodobacter sp. NTK016B]MBN8293246.1 hypothetical protein [Rhodobacter sp. NTK016B]